MSLGEAEQRFLLRAVLQLPAEQPEPLDWEAVARAARWHGIAALAWRTAVGVDALETLRGPALDEAAQTALHVSAFARTTRVLRAAGLDGMALKGVALVATDPAYQSLRMVSDLDLLVRAEDVERVDVALVAAGARRAAHRPTVDGAPGLASLAAQAHVAAVANYADAPGAAIDLHVRPPAELEDGIEALWGRSSHVTVHGVEVRVPSLLDQRAILCGHALHHHGADPRFLPRHLADLVRMERLGVTRAAGPPAVAASWRLLADARTSLELRGPRRLAVSQVARALDPETARVEGAYRAAGVRVRERASLVAGKGLAALFPSRAYLAAAYGVDSDAWWIPLLHVRRLLVDQPLAVLGFGRPSKPPDRAR